MIDTIPTSHSAIFNAAPRRLPRSFYWGAGFALLLHAGLVYYLVAQTFGSAIVDPAPPPESPVEVTFDRLQKPQPPAPPVNKIMVHQPPVTQSQPQSTPLTPQTTPNAGPDTKQPPLIAPSNQGATGGSASASSAGPVYVTPRWTRFPDGNTLSQYYPQRALDNEIEGSVDVQCTVVDAAGRVHCAILSETPKGYGLGAATVRMIEEKGRVDTSQGDIRAGSVLTSTVVRWQLN
ncbi:MAG: hypothetical protein ACXU8U_08845 [Asticcacaulis sp.]